MDRPRCIAITGLGNSVADRFAARLLDAFPETRVVAVGVRVPTLLRGRIELETIDLGEAAAAAALSALCTRGAVDVLAHLPFEPAPGEGFEGGPGWLSRAARHVAEAVVSAGVRRLVFSSSTMLYGPRPQNPNFCSEERPLFAHPDSPWLQDQCGAEEEVLRLAVAHRELEVSVLRHCWTAGPGALDPILQYLGADIVPTPWGRDPLVQLIHERDLLDVYERAVFEPHPGVFNIVGDGVLPVSRLLALAGRRSLPLPARLLRAAPRAPSLGLGDESPDAFFDFLRYLWVADGAHGWHEFGRPRYTTQEAWIAFASSRRPPRGWAS